MAAVSRHDLQAEHIRYLEAALSAADERNDQLAALVAEIGQADPVVITPDGRSCIACHVGVLERQVSDGSDEPPIEHLPTCWWWRANAVSSP